MGLFNNLMSKIFSHAAPAAAKGPQTAAAATTTSGIQAAEASAQPTAASASAVVADAPTAQPAAATAAPVVDVAAVLNDNRRANRMALARLLALAQAASILGPGDPQKMMEQFFALLWGDLLLSRLLGASAPTGAEIALRATEATAAFLKLCCARAN